MRARSLLMVIAGLMFGSAASAGVYCTESLLSVIAHDDGNYYFKSDKTCQSAWCQIAWGPTDGVRNRNGYAMLLTAKASERQVMFFWPNITSCTQANATYASPSAMELL